ncbi:MAG: CBS domain-containing protein [Dehalococcoidia bacterium]
MIVKDVMTADVEIISPELSIREAAERMKAFDVGALIVSHVFDLHGVITDRDLVIRGMADGLDPDQTPVGSIMTMEPVFCYEDDDLSSAAAQMEQHGTRRIAVLKREDSRLAGILSLVDIAAGADDPKLCASVMPRVSGAR